MLTAATVILKLVRQPVTDGDTKICCNPTTTSLKKLYARKRDRKLCRWEQISARTGACMGAKTLPEVEAKDEVQNYKRLIY
jgi:hypothetical protein